jgi:hypothetical protein
MGSVAWGPSTSSCQRCAVLSAFRVMGQRRLCVPHPFAGTANTVAQSVGSAGGCRSRNMAPNVAMPLGRHRQDHNKYLIPCHVKVACKAMMPSKFAACRRVFQICSGGRSTPARAFPIHRPRRMTMRGLPFHDGSAKGQWPGRCRPGPRCADCIEHRAGFQVPVHNPARQCCSPA